MHHPSTTTDGPTPHQLSERIARVEERLKTMQAEYEGALERLSRQLAERDTANTRWVVGSIAVAAVFIVAVVGLLLRWPGPTVP